jgi:hypothetical protein
VPFRPWGEALYTQRNDNARLDNPSIRCLADWRAGGLNAYTHPYKIVQTPDLIVILYESGTMFRQIFLDGRYASEGAAAGVARLLHRTMGRRHAGDRDCRLSTARHGSMRRASAERGDAG